MLERLLIDPGTPGGQLLLVRSSISTPGELAYCICRSTYTHTDHRSRAGRRCRWAVEELFQFTKNKTGLGHHQDHKYQVWYRRSTLSILADPFFTVGACHERQRDKKGALQPAKSC